MRRSRRAGLVACPICGAAEVDKAPMAPAVGAKGNQAGDAPSPAAVKAMLAELAAAQKQLLEKSEHVGDRFADEARAIHLGEAEARAIHGRASPRRGREPASTTAFRSRPCPSRCPSRARRIDRARRLRQTRTASDGPVAQQDRALDS